MFLCLFATITLAEKPAGLVGEWNFDEAQGDVIRDTSGIGKGDGKFINGQRIKQADGFALEMNGSTTYADCGSSEARGITSPVSIEGWIKPTRKAFGEASLFGTAMQGYVLTYYNTDIVLFYIGSGGNNVRGPVTVDQWNHVLATFDGERMRIWVNGRKTGDRESRHKTYRTEGNITIGSKGRPDLPKFKGPVDKMRVYNRAFEHKEAVAHFKAEAGDYGFDTTWFKRVKVTPYYYFHRNQIVVKADFKGLQPLPDNAHLKVTLASKDNPQKIIQQNTLDQLPDSGVAEIKLQSDDIADGNYIVRVILEDDNGKRPVEQFSFSYPAKPTNLPAPKAKTVGPMPPPLTPTPFEVNVGKAGGFQITTKGASYSVQTRVSWPNGRFNHLIPGDAPFNDGEKSWTSSVQTIGTNKYQVITEGDFYTITREVEVFPTHIYINDTYTNKTNTDLGLLIYNELPVKSDQIVKSYLSGNERAGRLPILGYPDYAPSLFFNDAKSGMGVIPIDDVYVIQAEPYVEKGLAGVCTEKFALAPGASYTLEWSIYPTGSGDYYDFINTFRKVEDRIGTVEGAPGFISWGPMNRRQVPDKDFISVVSRGQQTILKSPSKVSSSWISPER
jgi:hypothetical protein